METAEKTTEHNAMIIPEAIKYASVSAVAPQIAAIIDCFNTPKIFIINIITET